MQIVNLSFDQGYLLITEDRGETPYTIEFGYYSSKMEWENLNQYLLLQVLNCLCDRFELEEEVYFALQRKLKNRNISS